MRMLTGNSRRFQRTHDYRFGQRRTAPSVVRGRVELARPSREESRMGQEPSEN